MQNQMLLSQKPVGSSLLRLLALLRTQNEFDGFAPVATVGRDVTARTPLKLADIEPVPPEMLAKAEAAHEAWRLCGSRTTNGSAFHAGYFAALRMVQNVANDGLAGNAKDKFLSAIGARSYDDASRLCGTGTTYDTGFHAGYIDALRLVQNVARSSLAGKGMDNILTAIGADSTGA